MKKFFALTAMGILLAAGAALWAQNSQSVPGLQTSFPIQGQGLKAVSTFPPSTPQGSIQVLRPFHATPTPYKSHFYTLQPTPHPTPIRSQKNRHQPPGGSTTLPTPKGPVTLLGPRDLKYHTLYQDPTPTGSRAAH